MTSRPQFPHDPLGLRKPLQPGALTHVAGLTLEERIAELERGALGRPGPGVSDGSVITSDTSQTGGVAWTKAANTAVTFASGWADYGGSYAGAKYAKFGDGSVVLSGLVARAVAGSGTIFTLPTGHRPAADLVFIVASVAGYSRVDVTSAGTVALVPDPGTGVAFLSLSTISFLAA